MQIVNLKTENIDEVLDLFCECFAEDHYYLQLLQDYDDKQSAMRTLFKDAIAYCLQEGNSIGVVCGEQLVAFALLFNYRKARNDNQGGFNAIFGQGIADDKNTSAEGFHQRINAISGDIMYLLSVAVTKSYTRRGLASGIIDLILEKYPYSTIISDVSNAFSLPIYKERNFLIEPIEEGYYLVIHHSHTPTTLNDSLEPIRLLVPCLQNMDELAIEYKIVRKERYLLGCTVENSFGVNVFHRNHRSKKEVCTGVVVEISYQSLLQYQRLLNLSNVEECTSGSILFYVNYCLYTEKPLINETLADMLSNRKTEWSLVPDVFVSIPFEYTDLACVDKASGPGGHLWHPLLKYMDFRTHYEAGIPSNQDKVDDLAGLKNRIKRFYLGRVKVQIYSEITADNYKNIGDSIGPGALVDLYVAVDTGSNCAVLTWYSLSCPFLISHLFDTIIRNQLMVIEKDNCIVNFYDYIQKHYKMIKRGTPKIFSTFPVEKDVLSKSQLSSLLMAETIYPDGENFGEIIDEDLLAIVNREHGMGQYDRAYVCAYTNTVLQFSSNYKGSVADRLSEGSITLFYIELILFEEAAIQIADRSIIDMVTTDEVKGPVAFLSQVDAINDCYFRTIDFWDIRVNYPSSQKSIAMLRSAFRIKELLSEMNRNREQLQIAFDTKCNIVDRKDAKRMDTSLAIISILVVFSAWIDGHDYIGTWNDVLANDTIHLLQRILFVIILLTAGYAIFRLFGNKISMYVKKKIGQRNKRRKNK